MSAPQARRAATDRLKAYLTRRGTAGISAAATTDDRAKERGVGEHATRATHATRVTHATRAMTEDRAQERVEAARGAQ